MSRYYSMAVTIYGHKPNRKKAIVKAAKEEWPFAPFEPGADEEGNHLALWSRGESNLCGGESEEEFTTRLSRAIWEANGGYCRVAVDACCLEDTPTERHELDEDAYRRLAGKAGNSRE